MGYPRIPMASLWPNGGNKTIWGNIQAKKHVFSKKILYVIPSALLSFLPYYCHSFRIFVIPSVLKVFDSQGYLWLPYDLTEVIKLIGERFEPEKYFFQKSTLCHSFHISVIPSIVLSFLPDYCHSFRITVIPSRFLSFLPYYCHFFGIIVISNISHPE